MAGNLVVDTINSKDISSSLVATESQVIGVGQTWQDVTASRVAGTTYTNSTGKPIYIYIRMGDGAYDLLLTINGSIGFNMSNNNGRGSVQAIIPNGSTYLLAGTFNVWNELR